MNVTAEMILDIARLKTAAAQAEKRLNSIADVGERAGRRMNRGFSDSAMFKHVPGHRQLAGNLFSNSSRQAASMQGAMSSVSVSAGTAAAYLDKIGEAFSRVARYTVAVGAGMAGWKLARSVVEAGDMEQTLLKMQVFAKSARQGKQIMEQLSRFSPQTPFELTSIEAGTLALMEAGVEAGKVVGLVKDLARVSENDEAFLGLAESFGKGFTKQKFDGEQLTQFLERGVNLYPYLAKVRGQAIGDLVKSISAGDVSATDVQAALKAMSQEGGQFFGLLERRAKTLPGLWSTMLDSIVQLQRQLGKPFLDPVKSALDGIIKRVGTLTAMVSDFSGFASMFAGLGEAFQRMNLIENLIKSFETGWKQIAIGAISYAVGIRDAFQGVFSNFWTGIREAMSTSLSGMLTMMVSWAKGVGESMVATYQRMWASMYEGLAKLSPLGAASYRNIAGSLRRTADSHQDKADEYLSAGRNAWKETIKSGLLGEMGAVLNAAREVRRAFQGAKALRDGVVAQIAPGPERSAAVDMLTTALTAMSEHVFRAQKAANIPGTGETGAGIDAPESEGTNTKGRYVTPGSLAQQFNRLAGRSMSDLLLVESKQQNRALEKLNRTMERIERKLSPGESSGGSQFAYP